MNRSEKIVLMLEGFTVDDKTKTVYVDPNDDDSFDTARDYKAMGYKVVMKKGQQKSFPNKRSKSSGSKSYMEVPFKEKDIAKKQGLRWDPSVKKWYASGFTNTAYFNSQYPHWHPVDDLVRLYNGSAKWSPWERELMKKTLQKKGYDVGKLKG